MRDIIIQYGVGSDNLPDGVSRRGLIERLVREIKRRKRATSDISPALESIKVYKALHAG